VLDAVAAAAVLNTPGLDAVDEIEWAVNSGPFSGAGLVEQTRTSPKIVELQ
jgi:hypothetical protein